MSLSVQGLLWWTNGIHQTGGRPGLETAKTPSETWYNSKIGCSQHHRSSSMVGSSQPVLKLSRWCHNKTNDVLGHFGAISLVLEEGLRSDTERQCIVFTY